MKKNNDIVLKMARKLFNKYEKKKHKKMKYRKKPYGDYMHTRFGKNSKRKEFSGVN